MDYVWELVAPWVAAVGGAGGVGTIVYFIVRSLTSRALAKNNTLLNSTFNIDAISVKVAERLAGKTLNVDVTAVTERALERMSRKQDAQSERLEGEFNSLKRILAPIGKGVIKLKALTEDEIAELASAIKAIEKEYKPPVEKEIMTVVLQPVTLTEDTEEAVPAGGVNFDGLESE